MSAHPSTDPDPPPGDVDADLAKLDPRYVEHREGDSDARLVELVEIEGEDAKRFERLSEAGTAVRRATSSPTAGRGDR